MKSPDARARVSGSFLAVNMLQRYNLGQLLPLELLRLYRLQLLIQNVNSTITLVKVRVVLLPLMLH